MSLTGFELVCFQFLCKYHLVNREYLKTVLESFLGTQIPRDGRAIDIGAGTGLSGQALRDIGFTGQIDALEPTENMFVQAQPKNIFTLWYHELLLENKVR